MLAPGMHRFSGRRVLLLQGPVGPFFRRLARDLRAVGARVSKVNFNAGDWFYYRHGAMNYRGTMEAWPDWLHRTLRRLNIDVICLFGDCRPIHQAAHAVATRLQVDVVVLEEGYVRPDYVTFEQFGVNGYSKLPRIPDAYGEEVPQVPAQHRVGNTYWAMIRYGFGYFMTGWLGKPFFPHYVHHRPLTVLEAFPWVRSAWRKIWYRWTERGQQARLTASCSQRFFLVPLQVFNDAQVTVHAQMDGIEEFIESTLRSFAQHAPPDTLLVFKHHPMDRGYRDYGRLIRALARQATLAQRVIYLHDQHLPSLLMHARGVVVVNSTVGLSALHHGAPTLVCGKALYDMPGLTYQGGLDRFWAAAPDNKPDADLYKRFRSHVIARTQLNGSFYKPLAVPGAFAGLVCSAAPAGAARPPPPQPAMEAEQKAVATQDPRSNSVRLMHP